MGKNPPHSFAKTDKIILLRGLIEMPLDYCEIEVKKEIISLLLNSKEFDFSDFTIDDFEFIDVCGKKASIPLLRDNQEFNGRCVKQLAGQGAIYIRLTKPFSDDTTLIVSDDSDFEPKTKIPTDNDSDSSFELPVVDFKSSTATQPSSSTMLLPSIATNSAPSSHL
jgi:hypothetical protein